MSSTYDTTTSHAGGPPAAAGAPPDPGSDPAHTPARGVFVGFVIFALVVSTLAMMAFIWYRWAPVREPTTAVIVQGDATLDGTVVTVVGAGRAVTGSLTRDNKFTVPILVDPGVYTVRAEHDGRTLIEQDVEVKRFFGIIFDLSDYTKRIGGNTASTTTSSGGEDVNADAAP